jgi:DNA mismatch repair protein MutS2
MDELKVLWAWVEELLELLRGGEDPPLGEILDLQKSLGEDERIPGPLEAAELAAVGAACRELSSLLRFVRGHADELPLSVERFARSEDPGTLGDHLLSALEPDGRLKDGASGSLRSLRAAVQAALAQVRRTAQAEMQRASAKGWTTADELVLRGDRFCIPLRASDRTRVEGVIHDRSFTGQTLFVEALPVVESSNQLQEARLNVQEEEARILRRLNVEVSAAAKGLLELHRGAIEVDSLRARARWGLKHDAFVPRFFSLGSAPLRLRGFRHPLLQASLRRSGRERELIPLDLTLDESDRVLLLSGPNAGGKTVVLKSVGLAACMVQTGIPLPTESAPEIPVFDKIYLELGDDQSLANALSHFSAHLSHLKAMHEEATAESLVLLDEVGGGTDPAEGVALARAYLEILAETAGRVLATTHYGQLKALVHEREEFRNASMAYDAQRLLPLFRLVMDAPGASRGLQMAARMGLDPRILSRAEELAEDDSLRLNAVLVAMEDEREVLTRARKEVERELAVLAKERGEFESRAREIKQQRREILDRAEREAEGIVRRARARIESLLAEIRAEGADASQIAAAAQRAREEVDRRAESLRRSLAARRTPLRGHRPARVEVGAVVHHASSGLTGTIVEIRGNRVVLLGKGRRVQVPAEELVEPEGQALDPLAGTKGEPGTRGGGIRLPEVDASAVASRVDVRGYEVEEAWMAVDKAIDRCVLADTRVLEVVHGKGTGTLRRELHARLDRDPRVLALSLADGRRGDDGLTLVNLS